MAGASKQLSCDVCGQVMATVVWRTFKALEITAPDGFLAAPVSDDLVLPIAQQHLASAAAPDQPEAQRRGGEILRDAGDRCYDLWCPQGHDTPKTAPEITTAICGAAAARALGLSGR